MKYTPNYRLPLWDGEDSIRRADFNAAMDTIDAAILVGTGKYGYLVTLTDEGGQPLSNVTISGMTTNIGGTCVTNANGQTLGVSTGKTVTLTFSHNFIDLPLISTVTLASAGVITRTTIIAQRSAETTITIYSSKSFRFSPGVKTFDAAVCGGGGSGSMGRYAEYSPHGGPGGGGGYVSQINGNIPDTGVYIATVGGASGKSSIQKQTGSFIVTANGGANAVDDAYGAGNGNGGAAHFDTLTVGNPGGTGRSTFSLIPSAGGGGGSGSPMGRAGGAGGGPHGGRGATGSAQNFDSGTPGQSGTIPGGGGGGGHIAYGSSTPPGSGAQGIAAIKVYY